MKKKLLLFILFLLIPLNVKADKIDRVDMKIYLDQYGNANIEETWTATAYSGTEWYKEIKNLGNSEITNFKVSMDDVPMSKKTYWDLDASLDEKRGYYGINQTSTGIELCFGKGDFKSHTFILTYTLSNFVFNTDDSQVLYWTLIPKATLNNFKVEVTSYYNFPETLDVWGFGYKGYAYVENGKISMSNEGKIADDYVTLLAKFPLNTFNITNINPEFKTFDEVLAAAKEGTFEYNYDTSFIEKIFNFITTIIPFIIFGLISLITFNLVKNSSYGYVNNKKIDKNNTPMFRDIPCNKDIYYANALMSLNKFGYKETNIMGAIILKWVREDKIRFGTTVSGLFKKEKSTIDLTLNPTFDNNLEKELFDMMYKASKDGILETNELEKWCRNNYDKFLNLFKKITENEITKLKEKGSIYKRTYKEECKFTNVMDDKIYDDSQKLYGLKLYLEEFSRMDTKEVMEVKLWDEYLMFAYIFGIADKVAKQLKDLYPEVLENPENNIDYITLVNINNISSSGIRAASSARAAAENYSGGGGGFSSGGGGGGSFGGGSMGGR